MIFHINYPSILSGSREESFIFALMFLFGPFAFILSNYKQAGLLNKSSLLAGRHFGNPSPCQVLIGTDPTLVPLTSAKHDGPV